MFQLFTGSFRDIETRCLTDLEKLKKTDPLACLLVLSPSGHMLTRLQTELSRRANGTLHIQFLTFYALAERLLADSGYTEQVITEPALQVELIREILSGGSPEAVDLTIRQALHLDGSQRITRGLAGALSSTLRDLRDSGMRADYALQAAKEGFLGTEAPEAASTLALYGRMTGLLQKYRFRTPADLLRRAAERAPAHPWIQNQKAIFLYGFYDLTGMQLDLVTSLADHPDARVYFPYEKGNPAYSYAEKLLNDPAFAGQCDGSADRRGGGSATHPSDVPPTRRPAPSPTPSIWSCSGSRDEVWLTAKEILRLTEDGVSFNDIAVVSRNLLPYLPALSEIFSAHQIPYSSHRAEPAGSHPLIKTVRALLTFDERHPSAKTLRADLEKSPYLSRPIATFSAGLAEGPWLSHIAWAAGLIESFIRLPKEPNAEESGLLKSILETLENLKILETLRTVVSRDHFLETWTEKLDAIDRPLPNRHEGVQVLDIQQARGLSFRALFVVGMNEKVFPRLIREDPFLSDAARGSLAQAIGVRLGRKLDGYEEERFLFELTKRAATDYLYVLTQRSDEEGKALIPSVYLKEMERDVPGLEVKRLPRAIAEKFENRPPLSWTPKELSFLINRAQRDPAPVYSALSWDVPGYYRLLAAHRAIEEFKPGVGPYDGVIEDLKPLQATLAKPFSPSSLEDLAQCPHQYYSAHILRITPPEELAPGGEMTPQALGKVFHRVLELFYTECRDHDLPNGDAEVAERLEKAYNSCFKELEESLSTIYPLALKSNKELIKKELLSFIKSDLEEAKHSGYRPSQFEQPLEGKLPIEGLPYRFYGKPDRLDTRQEAGEKQVRVVDYKSGKPKKWTGRIETQVIQGKFLQLPIYLGLAGAVQATLRPVRETDEEAKEKTLKADFWSSAAAKPFAENIKELIGLIEKGIFYIEPDTSERGHCKYCHFAKVCRKEHMPTRIRAERDPLRVRVSDKLARTAPK